MNYLPNRNSQNRGRIIRLTKEGQSSFPSVTARLRYREINGFCKRSIISLGSKKQFLSRRFAFPIKSLIHERYLEEGHIILGFSSCDKFLISYTETVGEAGHSGFLSHVYTLHWWLWDPGRTATKVGSVRLFANEEIEYSLFICYAEWPISKSRVVVYGYRKHCDSGYITFATVPTLSPCKECNILTASFGDATSKSLCIKHGYTVHFKQASGTSQTGVLNSSGLKIDDILVLNIGHSIAVLSTGIVDDIKDLDNLPLSSIKRSANEEPISDAENDILVPEETVIDTPCNSLFTAGIDRYGVASFDDFAVHKQNEGNLTCEVYDIDKCDLPESISLNQRHTTVDKENRSSAYSEIFETQISLEVDPYFDPEPKSIVLNGGTIRKTEESRIPKACPSCRQTKLTPNTIFGEPCSCVSSNKHRLPRYAHNCILNEKQNSRSELSFMTPSPTASDGSSSVQLSESGITMNSSRPTTNQSNSDGLVSFSESFYGPINPQSINEDQPIPIGDTNFQFCTMTCTGALGEALHPLDREHFSIQAYSQNLVLDIEHVIFDILRTRCYAAYKYGYLVDYEANILDVSSSTNSVIIHIAAVLNIRHTRNKVLHSIVQERSSSQQAEFILCWSLSSGRYEVVVARPLVPYDERKSGEWKGSWILAADSIIKKHCSIPSDPHKCVYILDNSAVLRGRSLNILWNCDRTLAITK